MRSRNHTIGSCHYCSRRRLRCDRSKPSCHKCSVSGLECPGYERLFTWVQGRSARPRKASSGDSKPADTVGPARGGSRGGGGGDGGDGGDDDDGGGGSSGRGGATTAAALRTPSTPLGCLDLTSRAATRVDGSTTRTVAAPSSGIDSALPKPLRDNGLGHVDETTRLYLEHFATRVCKDLVAHDHPGSNPFRQLIPLALDYPFLLHILVASSALHLFNTIHCTQIATTWSSAIVVPPSPPPPHPPSPPSSSPTSEVVGPHIRRPPRSATGLGPGLRLSAAGSRRDDPVPFPTDHVSRTALTSALAAKQRAIRSLRSALERPASTVRDREVLLAAILFFINFELIDIGHNGWQPHLRGAGRLMALLGEVDRSSSHVENRLLFDVVVSDCLIYHVLGSTLSPAWLTTSITHQVLDLFPVLERTEAYTYLCCPTALLEIILATSQLSVSVLRTSDPATHAAATVSALELLDRALAIDTRTWAARVARQHRRPSSGPSSSPAGAAAVDRAAREHVASAHRSAACLYILQAIPWTRAVVAGRNQADESQLVADLLWHLEQIGETNAHFKATSWPTFVAGAETQDPQTRAWLLGRLLAVWKVCPWGYLFTAVETLRTMWAARDAQDDGSGGVFSSRGEEGGAGQPGAVATERVSGLRQLWAMNVDCLVV